MYGMMGCVWFGGCDAGVAEEGAGPVALASWVGGDEFLVADGFVILFCNRLGAVCVCVVRG